MPTIRSPRHGSLGVAPRKRAKRIYSRIRKYPDVSEAKIVGFAGYKAGMTQVVIVDNNKNSMTKNEEIVVPVTIIECPALRIIGVRLYGKTERGLNIETEIFSSTDKLLARKLRLPKKEKAGKLDEMEKRIEEASDVRVQVCTQPHLTMLGKKKPEVFEIAVGGKDVKEKFAYAKANLGKEVNVADVLKAGEQVDLHSVTKGKGYQGPVKRFGISLKSHKSEKGRRAPGNLGPWAGNRSWTVAHAGQMGLHKRMQKNNIVIKVSESSEGINPKGGFLRYGPVKNPYLLVKGSVSGAAKRLIRFTPSRFRNSRPHEAPVISSVNTASKQ